MMFFIVNVAGIAIRITILLIGELPLMTLFEKLGLSDTSSNFLVRNFTLAIAMGVVLLWNFFINRYWTYNDVDKAVI